MMVTKYSRDKEISLTKWYACVRCGWATQYRKEMIEHFKQHKGDNK
jgi:hypothetical protein